MFEKLEQLRKMPDHKKRYVAFGTAACITGFIFVFWIVSLSVTLGSPDQEASAADAAGAASGVSPFAALTANLNAALAPVGGAFHNIVSHFSGASSTATTTPPIYVGALVPGAYRPDINLNTYGTASPSAPVASSTTDMQSSPGPVSIDHLLVLGDSGPEVLLLQKALAGQGFYTGPLNTKLGPLTDAALIRFQAAFNIVAAGAPGSGQVGPKTREAINQLSLGSTY
jgi:hypothetical protein